MAITYSAKNTILVSEWYPSPKLKFLCKSWRNPCWENLLDVNNNISISDCMFQHIFFRQILDFKTRWSMRIHWASVNIAWARLWAYATVHNVCIEIVLDMQRVEKVKVCFWIEFDTY